MRHHSNRLLHRSIGSAASILVCLAFVAASCGPGADPCVACPDIEGTFRVDSAVALGSCDFQPLTLGPNVTLTQSPDTATLSTMITDPVTGEELELTGEIYNPGAGDDVDVVASFSMSAQTVRPAVQFETRLITLLVTMSGTVRQSEGERQVGGSLSSQDLTPGTQERCRVTINFNADEASEE